MGVLRAGFHGTVGQPSAQIIDGSLKFDSAIKNRIDRTATSGSGTTWTLALWVKKQGNDCHVFGAGAGNNPGRFGFGFNGSDQIFALVIDSNSTVFSITTSAVFRDNDWYHIVLVADTTNGTQADRFKVYVNGVLQTVSGTLMPPSQDTFVNSSATHTFGRRSYTDSDHFSGQITNAYLIDGQALEESDFGYTDGLTNTWRPKKYTGTFGTNGFWLPMDGSAPIGQDQSGQGNDWTPVNFGGSVELDKATGALPILNTTPGGTQAGVGVFGSKEGFFETVSSSSGGGNPYIFDSRGTQPTLSFIRGATYVFDYSSATSHPLRFATAADAAGSTQYTDGTSVSGNVISFTVPHNAPNTLYYYCTNHGGMGNSISVTTDETKADPYAWKNVLALPLVGTANDVSNQINSGSTTKVITENGDPTASTAQSEFYGGSYLFDGTGDYLSTPDSADYAMGTDDWTVEMWIHPTASSQNSKLLFAHTSGGDYGWCNLYFGSGTLKLYCSSNGSSWTVSNIDIGTPPVNKWSHIAVSRSGSTFRTFFNGVHTGSATSSSSLMDSTGTLQIGARNGTEAYTGYIQDVRIYKGIAKYTSDFIPAATNPDVLPDTPSGVSGNSKLAKITDGAVAFGSDDYITTTSSDYNPGTGDFAIEGYFRFPDNSGTRRAFINDTGTFGSNSMVIRQYNDGFNFYCGGQSLDDSGSGTNMAQWNHALMTRSGSTVRYFVNGELRGTDTTSNSISAEPTNQLTIGGFYDSGGGGEYMNGHASNLRLTVGSIPTDYQTSSTTVGTRVFTPSSEPLTSTSQGATSSDVKLLCCQSNTSANEAAVGQKAVLLNAPLSSTPFTDSSPTGATITNNGSITAVSAGTNSFNITNAASQNGSNQWFTTNNTNITFQGSWTVDIYFKLDSSASGYNALINSGYGTQTSHYMYIGLNDDEYPYLETSSSGSRTLAQHPLSKNVWYHGRVTQDGSTMTFYVNGNSVVTKTAQTADLSSGGAIFTIGSLNNESAGSNSFHGLIGPVRILDTNIGAPSAGGDATSSGTLSNSFGDVVKVNGDAVSTTFNPFNTDINTVRGQESGYCTLNPLFYRTDPLVLSDGNLTAEATGSNGSGNWKGASSTFGQTSGKWFAEFTLVSKGGTNHANIGINPIAKTDAGTNHGVADSGHFYTSNGKFWNASTESGVIADQYLAGDVIGVTVDFDASEIKWYKNDVLQNTVSLNSNILASGFVWALSNYTTSTVACNFGQKPFKFPPPDGFQPLNNANVRPETVIVRPDQFVGVTTYLGVSNNDEGDQQIVSGYKFAPDMMIFKNRDDGWYWWLYDTVRGSNGLVPHEDQGEYDDDSIVSYNSDGVTVRYHSTSTLNHNGKNYVAWAWKAGGDAGTFNKDDVAYASAAAAGITGLDGTGEMTTAKFLGCSIGTKQGFSIIKYRGLGGGDVKVPHGLSQTPDMVIVKNLDSSVDWAITHSGLPGNRSLRFTTADTSTSGFLGLNKGGLASTYFTINYTDTNLKYVNASNEDYIAYCWHSVPGLQKFGSYVGNGDPDGPFVYTGFRIKFLMVKRIDSIGGDWRIFDTERDPSNVTIKNLFWNNSDQEGGSSGVTGLDIVSNGFKLRASHSALNPSSGTYIYAAWAEAPTVNLYGGQSNAR